MKLIQGDCIERMNEIPDGSVDMVLTDPPDDACSFFFTMSACMV